MNYGLPANQRIDTRLLSRCGPPQLSRSAPPRSPHLGWDKPLFSGRAGDGRGPVVRGDDATVQDGDGRLADGVALTPEAAERLGGLYARIVDSVQSVLYADDRPSSSPSGVSSPRATCWSRTFRGWARPHWRRRSPVRLGSTSTGCSSPPTYCRRTSPARWSSTASEASPSSARPDLHQPLDGRRTEPGVGSVPVRAPGGDGGAPGHRGRHDHAPATTLHGARHPEPLRRGRYVAAPARAARPFPPSPLAWLSEPGTRGPAPGPRGPSPPVDTLGPALSRSDLDALLRAVRDVHVSDAIRGYILDIVAASRAHPALAVGASPRGAIALRQASCAMALAAGPALCRALRRAAGRRAGARPPARPAAGQRAIRDGHRGGRHRPRPSDPPSGA